MAYIRVDKDQPTHPRMFEIVDALAADLSISIVTGRCEGRPVVAHDLEESTTRELLRNAILGGLVTLWVYADRHIRADDTLPVTVTGASQVCGLPVTWLEAIPEEWLRVREDGLVELPNYCKKNHIVPKAERQRNPESKGAQRTRRYRQKKNGVTHESPLRHNTPLTGTGTGTVNPTGTGDRGAAPLAAANGAAATPPKSFDQDFRERFGHEPVRAKGRE